LFSPVFIKSKKRYVGYPSTWLLGALAASGPLALSIHVQSVPAISEELEVSYSVAQLTVSLFLITFAASQLIIGPLSDKIGRRPVIFGGLVLLGLSSLAATFAPSIELLILARIIQGFGGCATLVVPRAIVQDLYKGLQAAKMTALVAMVQSIAPLSAPIIGGILDNVFGWRAVFAFLTLFTFLLSIWALGYLKETRVVEEKENKPRWGEIFIRYIRLLSNRTYVGYTLAFAAGTSGFFGFLAIGPVLVIERMSFEPIIFSLLLMFITLQFPFGNYVASRINNRLGIDRTLLLGAIIGVVASVILFFLSSEIMLLAILFPMLIYALSNGILFPNAMAGAVGVDPKIAGTAASFAGFCQLGAGAFLSFLISNLSTETIAPYSLSLIFLSIVALFGVLLIPSISKTS
jgi:DHA1 family bicyclomycin/chloramphenicol resistance-like MFS transporter|tara:strand:- start:15475 stop:16689 length:1215 start_codon:yes stop_codon:yes gene_type:complete